MKENIKTDLHVVVFLEGESFVAQCLEYDINAAYNNGEGQLSELLERFTRAFIGEIVLCHEHNDPILIKIKPAPEYYWKKFEFSLKLKEKIFVKTSEWFPKSKKIKEIPSDFRFQIGIV